PPLTEGVTWYVIEQTEITMSSNQVARYQQFFEPNNRHVQAINRRPIFRGAFKQLNHPAGDDALHG
ncbi:carbonic anhydrase family protein, partial [Lactobacillus paracasei]|nr:carbonic anhydrase family protein [Lacticaseibacillus paracasei]